MSVEKWRETALAQATVLHLHRSEMGQKRAVGAPQLHLQWSPNTGHHAALG